MGSLMRDGTVVSSKVPRQHARPDAHYEMYGLFLGIVKDVIYPDDPLGDDAQWAVQYTVKVRGQLYYNARDLRRFGGIFDHGYAVRKPTQAPTTQGDSVYDNLLDGEAVWVMFAEGNADLPVILGSATHPRAGEYRRPKRAAGRRLEEEYQGVQTTIEADGSYQVTIVGQKSDDKGTLANQGAVGATIRIDGPTGQVTVTDPKGNEVVLGGGGVLVQDQNGNKVQLANNAFTLTAQKDLTGTVPGKVNLTITGDCNILASGNTVVEGAQITLKSASNTVAPGAVVCVNAANNDPITGIPLTGAGGVTAST